MWMIDYKSLKIETKFKTPFTIFQQIQLVVIIKMNKEIARYIFGQKLWGMIQAILPWDTKTSQERKRTAEKVKQLFTETQAQMIQQFPHSPCKTKLNRQQEEWKEDTHIHLHLVRINEKYLKRSILYLKIS